ncbi:MAG: hypothetical protein HJJLKODD_02530 [Phycisphaerae bacterium]|nr:hypothetical protein [Phycisphaerae bacterium]
MLISLILVFGLYSPWGQHATDERQPALEKSEARKIIREAEKQVAQLARSRPNKTNVEYDETEEKETINEYDLKSGKQITREIVHIIRTPKKRKWTPAYTLYEGHPLQKRTAIMDMAFKFSQTASDLVKAGYLHAPTASSGPSTDQTSDNQLYLVSEVDAGLENQWKLKDVYPELQEQIEQWRVEVKKFGEQINDYRDEIKSARKKAAAGWQARIEQLEKTIKQTEERRTTTNNRIKRMESDFKNELAEVKHKIVLKLPDGYAPPGKMPKRFEAVFHVREVRWDENAPLPYFVIYADLVKSEDLGLSAAGIIPDQERNAH